MADLNNDDGVNMFVNKLVILYVKDKKVAAYIAYERFKTFHHPNEKAQ